MNSSEKYNDDILIHLINNGYEDAFEFIFKEYYEALCSYLTFFRIHDDIIEQIVQELFVSIWENRQTFSPKGSIKSYLYRAVKNKSINHFKHESVKQKSIDDIKQYYYSNEHDIERQFENEELLKLIEDGVSELPEKCREIFLLIKFSGFSYRETASVLNISTKTVENQMGKALKYLREFLLPSIK